MESSSRWILILLFLSLSTLTTALIDITLGSPWDLYKKSHNKSYNPVEDLNRYTTWLKNVKTINDHNVLYSSGLSSFSMKQSVITDYTAAELQNKKGLIVPKSIQINLQASDHISSSSVASLPTSVDLRTSPCMSPIKDQGQCGSCWAFAATFPIEFQKCTQSANKKPLDLSEQQLVDCSSAQGNQGCNGGYYTWAWDYLKTKQLMSSNSYPYTSGAAGVTGTCKFKESAVAVPNTVVSYENIAQNSGTAIMTALASGTPVAVAVCACSSFMNYASGVYMDMTCMWPICNLDHAVVIVGYGTTPDIFGIPGTGKPYWIIRNSWGKSWGLNGYMLMIRGINQSRVSSMPATVTVQ